ncbi:MAG: hypothetical protein KGJ06_04840 [Pseudomonadota bacterium]|nr:hypothetical protein [Pseudomonadota bacterium]
MAKILLVGDVGRKFYRIPTIECLQTAGYQVEYAEVATAAQANEVNRMLTDPKQDIAAVVLTNLSTLDVHRPGQESFLVDPLEFAAQVKAAGKPAIVYDIPSPSMQLTLRDQGFRVLDSVSARPGALTKAVKDILAPKMPGYSRSKDSKE